MVAQDGELLGGGLGTPPGWIQNSAGAEAWAVYTVLAFSAEVPLIVTDCYGIITGIAEGRTKATSPTRPLARIWNMIYNVLDSEWVDADVQARMTWMPAHGARHTIGSRLRSDGLPVSTMDWRANRLADAAAKAATSSNRASPAQRIRLQRVTDAYEHALVELAIVTVAANNHVVEALDDTGATIRKSLRDSMSTPRTRRSRKP